MATKKYLDKTGHFSLLWIILQAASFQCVASVPSGCNPNVDLLIVVDASESIIVNDPYGKPLYNWNRLKTYLSGVIRQLPVPMDHRIGLIRYSDNVDEEFRMDQLNSSVEILQRVAELRHKGGNTNTAHALAWSGEHLIAARRPESKPVVLILTDGMSRDNIMTSQRARQLRNAGVEIFTVSLDTGDVDGDELYAIASSPQHRITAPAKVADSSAWEHAVSRAVYGICDLPVPNRDPFCDAILDVVLIIDNSGSINNDSTTETNYNYILLKEFIKSLLDILDISANKTRVGAIRFSTSVQTEFKLNTYMDDREKMKIHIDRMHFEGLRTNISGALRQTRFELFNGNYGDRPNIPNVAIVIADGESNVNEAETRPQARLLKEDNTRIFVVAVRTQKFDKKELEYIASDPDSDHYFVSPSIQNLPTLKCNLLKHVCREVTFDECV